MAKISTRNITRQNVEDILDTAGYGIVDFARTATVQTVGGELAYTFVERAELTESGREETHTITAAQVRQAVVDLAFEAYMTMPRAFADWTREDGIDTGEIDSVGASAVVQVAAFGKIVYG